MNQAKEHPADRFIRYADFTIVATLKVAVIIASGAMFWIAVAMCAAGYR